MTRRDVIIIIQILLRMQRERERKEKRNCMHIGLNIYIYLTKNNFSFFPFFEYDDIYKNNFLVLLFLYIKYIEQLLYYIPGKQNIRTKLSKHKVLHIYIQSNHGG